MMVTSNHRICFMLHLLFLVAASFAKQANSPDRKWANNHFNQSTSPGVLNRYRRELQTTASSDGGCNLDEKTFDSLSDSIERIAESLRQSMGSEREGGDRGVKLLFSKVPLSRGPGSLVRPIDDIAEPSPIESRVTEGYKVKCMSVKNRLEKGAKYLIAKISLAACLLDVDEDRFKKQLDTLQHDWLKFNQSTSQLMTHVRLNHPSEERDLQRLLSTLQQQMVSWLESIKVFSEREPVDRCASYIIRKNYSAARKVCASGNDTSLMSGLVSKVYTSNEGGVGRVVSFADSMSDCNMKAMVLETLFTAMQENDDTGHVELFRLEDSLSHCPEETTSRLRGQLDHYVTDMLHSFSENIKVGNFKPILAIIKLSPHFANLLNSFLPRAISGVESFCEKGWDTAEDFVIELPWKSHRVYGYQAIVDSLQSCDRIPLGLVHRVAKTLHLMAQDESDQHVIDLKPQMDKLRSDMTVLMKKGLSRGIDSTYSCDRNKFQDTIKLINLSPHFKSILPFSLETLLNSLTKCNHTHTQEMIKLAKIVQSSSNEAERAVKGQFKDLKEKFPALVQGVIWKKFCLIEDSNRGEYLASDESVGATRTPAYTANAQHIREIRKAIWRLTYQMSDDTFIIRNMGTGDFRRVLGSTSILTHLSTARMGDRAVQGNVVTSVVSRDGAQVGRDYRWRAEPVDVNGEYQVLLKLDDSGSGNGYLVADDRFRLPGDSDKRPIFTSLASWGGRKTTWSLTCGKQASSLALKGY